LSGSWLSVAIAELGVARHPGGQSNPRITEEHEAINKNAVSKLETSSEGE
jgi:hypothetical protein